MGGSYGRVGTPPAHEIIIDGEGASVKPPLPI